MQLRINFDATSLQDFFKSNPEAYAEITKTAVEAVKQSVLSSTANGRVKEMVEFAINNMSMTSFGFLTDKIQKHIDAAVEGKFNALVSKGVEPVVQKMLPNMINNEIARITRELDSQVGTAVRNHIYKLLAK